MLQPFRFPSPCRVVRLCRPLHTISLIYRSHLYLENSVYASLFVKLTIKTARKNLKFFSNCTALSARLKLNEIVLRFCFPSGLSREIGKFRIGYLGVPRSH